MGFLLYSMHSNPYIWVLWCLFNEISKHCLLLTHMVQSSMLLAQSYGIWRILWKHQSKIRIYGSVGRFPPSLLNLIRVYTTRKSNFATELFNQFALLFWWVTLQGCSLEVRYFAELEGQSFTGITGPVWHLLLGRYTYPIPCCSTISAS